MNKDLLYSPDVDKLSIYFFILSFPKSFYFTDQILIQVILLSKYLISSLVVIYLIEYSLLVTTLIINTK